MQKTITNGFLLSDISYMKIFRCISIFFWLNFVLDAILNMVNIAANILGAKTEDLTEGT